jgi:hypothetical protein
MRLKGPAIAALALILMGAAANESMTANHGARRIIPLPHVTTPQITLPDEKARLRLLEGKVAPQQADAIVRQAKAYLTQEPLTSDAVWMVSSRKTGTAQTETLALAERVSRRTAFTQSALFLTSARQGNLPETLLHLDRLLTIFPELGKSALSKLAASIGSPDVRAALRPLARRPWFRSFLLQAVDDAPSGDSLYQLITDTHALTGAPSPGLLPAVLHRLVKDGDISQAAALAERHGGFNAATRTTFGPNSATIAAEARPLTWTLASDESANVMLKAANSLAITIEPGRAALLMTRITLLPPGAYTMAMTASLSDPRAALRWEMTCLSDMSESAAWAQPVLGRTEKTTVSASLTIAANCPAQRWSLKGTTLDVQFPVDVEIASLTLAPARN